MPTIKRIYSYKSAESTIVTIDEESPFIYALEQVHSFIDCCHDQFDPARMSSFFKINKRETDRLRDLIWYFSFGNTALDQFKTNDKLYQKTNNIHKLAEALDRNPSNKFQFNIELPGAPGVKINCDYELPEMIEMPWDNKTSANLSGTFATYKFHNYTPTNSGDAGTLLREVMKSNNSAYILDCGKRLFHENFANKGKGISIFSGIIDSSTVNDPVLDIKSCPDAVKKLQFLIPFINIPRPNPVAIDMYCTFDNYDDAINNNNSPVKLFLSFLFKEDIANNPTFLLSDPSTNMAYLKQYYPSQSIVVTGADIPDLTNVTNYLAGPVRGCFNSLTNTLLKKINHHTQPNPCYLYEDITRHLFNRLAPNVILTESDFNQIFQIRFKHIGDKTRLIDAVIVNSLSAQYPDCNIPLCHTGTIDTFSNRYALLGNLYTITPIKKSNLFINDNKVLSAEQLISIRKFKKDALQRLYNEQKALFDLTVSKKEDIDTAVLIIPFIQNKIEIFRRNLILREKKTRSLSCVLANYYDVSVGSDAFINNSYTLQDIALIESMEIMLADILKSYSVVMETSFYDKMKTYFSNYDSDQDYNQPLHVLLDMIRLGDLFIACGITYTLKFETRKPMMSIATSIAKSGFSPALLAVSTQEGGNYSAIYDDAQKGLNEKEMIRAMNSLGITMYGDSQALLIKSKKVLMRLQKNVIIDKIKKDLYDETAEINYETIKNELKANNINVGSNSFLLSKENALISFLNNYQRAKNSEELVSSPSKKKLSNTAKQTRKKRRRPTSDGEDDTQSSSPMSYENRTPPDNTYNSPPQKKKDP